MFNLVQFNFVVTDEFLRNVVQQIKIESTVTYSTTRQQGK